MRVLTCLSLFLMVLMSPALAQTWAIDAPEHAHIRQDIEVHWTATQERGDILEVRPASGEARRLS